MMRRAFVALLLLFVCVPFAAAQSGFVSPTPVVIELPTQAALPTDIAISTPTPTWTPTEEAPISLVLNAESANVRLEPDPAGELLGQLEPGVNYVVTGNYFSWYQFAFDQSPTGRGWVFADLVTINGDPAQIAVIDSFAAPTTASVDTSSGTTDPNATPDPNATLNGTSQAEDSRELDINSPGGESALTGPLPTFTFPPEFVASARTPTATGPILPSPTPDTIQSVVNTFAEGNVPPIVPILLLGIGGIIGLFLSFLRR